MTTEYQQRSVSIIPKGWEVARLGDKEIAKEMYYGITAKATEKRTALRILRTTDIKDYSVNWHKLPFCEITEKRSNLARYELKKDDLIVARAGTVGVSVLVDRDYKNVVFGSYLIKVRLNPSRVYPKFVHYFFQSRLYWRHMRGAQGSTLRNINLPLLKSLRIPLPPIEEQRRIAEVLSGVDDAIRGVDLAVAKTERLKKGLMQKLLTEGIGHKEYKQTKTGKIPKEWEVLRLGEVLTDIRYGTSMKANDSGIGLPVLGIPNILGGRIDKSNMRHVELPEAEKRKLMLKDGDILVVRTNANPNFIGRCALFENTEKRWVYASYLIRIRPEKRRVDPRYLVRFLQSERARRQFLSRARTSAGNYNLNTQGIKSIVAYLPRRPEQQRIAEILSTVDENLELKRKRREKLERIKKGLMNDLLTGRMRVKAAM